jgi:hypothetical protein
VDERRAGGQYRNVHKDPLIPVEFAVAAYRFGLSQGRPSYRLIFGPDAGSLFFAFIFDDSLNPNDLRGEKRAPLRPRT